MKHMNYKHVIIMNYSKYYFKSMSYLKYIVSNVVIQNCIIFQSLINGAGFDKTIPNRRPFYTSVPPQIEASAEQFSSAVSMGREGSYIYAVFPGSSTLLSYRYNPRKQNTHYTHYIHVENLHSIVVLLFKNTRHR